MSVLEKTIKACQQGKRSAQKELYEQFAPKMFGVCLRYAQNRDEAEDFLQEGFIRAFEKIGQFRFEGSFEGWLRRLIVNLIVESLRKKKQLNETPLESYFDQADVEEDEGLWSDYSLEKLLKIIGELPDRYRMVFNLYVLEEQSHEEIAQTLGISEGTSKSNLSRARRWLQQRLSQETEKEL